MQHWCQIKAHIHTVHWQTNLLCILIDMISSFMLKVSHSEFHLGIDW
jgi:hypothetical protein